MNPYFASSFIRKASLYRRKSSRPGICRAVRHSDSRRCFFEKFDDFSVSLLTIWLSYVILLRDETFSLSFFAVIFQGDGRLLHFFIWY